MRKRLPILVLFLAAGIISMAVCLSPAGMAQAQQGTAFKDWPPLSDQAAWDKIEQRRQARLDMVSGVDAFNAGKYQAAVEHFERFVAVFPNDKQGMEYLDLARKWAAKSK